MAFWLRSEERRVDNRASRVRRDLAAVSDARERFALRLRDELARPKVLLGLFAAGLGFGWLRRGERPSGAEPGEDAGEEMRPTRLATIVAAVLAGVRIYDQARRAAAFIGLRAGRTVRDDAAPADEEWR